ncbi:MAG: sugar ABC transporter ATP-binding protein [Planctomycetota bacterium]|nr:sugar ABC transporter ATP-binding protein [Planctomycetota bacterium]
MQDIILKVEGLLKSFAGVQALKDISFEIRRGEVHAICGENGAGKSTFIKLLTGAETPSSGSIEFEGVRYAHLEPRQAMDLGISVIYQEFSLIPYLSVAENIFYGREIKKFGLRDKAEMNARAKALCDEMGIDIDICARVGLFGTAYQQIVEILKAVAKNAKFIIMDEPTASLTIKETHIFFGIIEKLKKNNTTIVFISHRLEEVFEICDRVTVFCDGAYITTKDVSELDRKQLISYMVGRELTDVYPAPRNLPGEVVFEARNVGNNLVHDVGFTLRKGEILGFGGLVGAGRTELARLIFGADPMFSGRMVKSGLEYRPGSPREALISGVGLIPEDRKYQGLILGQSICKNISFSSLRRYAGKLGNIKSRRENELVERMIRDLDIRAPSAEQLARNLSGGNQQKVVLARILATECDIMIFDEPTRGIDVGAKQEIYTLMCELADAGKSIVMISSEMPELIGMSHRIIVMGGGTVVGELRKEEFSQTRILEMASSKLSPKE